MDDDHVSLVVLERDHLERDAPLIRREEDDLSGIPGVFKRHRTRSDDMGDPNVADPVLPRGGANLDLGQASPGHIVWDTMMGVKP